MTSLESDRPINSVKYKGRDAIIISMVGGKTTLTYKRDGETPVFAVNYDDPNLEVTYAGN